MLNLFETFVTLHAQFCMFLESEEFLEFICWKEMMFFLTLNSSQAQLKDRFQQQKKQQLHDVTSPCWLVKRAGVTLESSLFDLCCLRLSPNPQTGVCN